MATVFHSPVTRLALNLSRFTRLSDDDCDALAALALERTLECPARTDLVREGEDPAFVRLMVEGWACRYKDLPDGRRQIVGFFVPGDFCDLNVFILQQMDHSIQAITPVRYLALRPDTLDALTSACPRIGQALLWHELVSSSIQREWLLNLGQRSALERVAHLLVELYYRLRAVDLADEEACDFPLTQTDLAAAAGITPIHVNRTLQDLRRDNLIVLRGRRLSFPDFSRLKRLAMFNPNYLHLDHEGRHLDARA